MSREVIERILSRPIEHLLLSKQRIPNKEVLRLYREVYKFSSKMYWNNEKGEPWRDILRKSARKEFDLSKQETDPFLVMKMMITTRQCLAEMDMRICAAQAKLTENVEATRNEPSEIFMKKAR